MGYPGLSTTFAHPSGANPTSRILDIPPSGCVRSVACPYPNAPTAPGATCNVATAETRDSLSIRRIRRSRWFSSQDPGQS